MTIRTIGSVMIAVGFSCIGFLAALSHKREVKTLKNFLASLDSMECELKYHKTPLPLLCKHISESQSGVLKRFYLNLSNELMHLDHVDAATCITSILEKSPEIPSQTRNMLRQIGVSLGKFDSDGQLLGIRSVRSETNKQLELLCTNQEQRLRSYRILGVCAGAAIAILVI